MKTLKGLSALIPLALSMMIFFSTPQRPAAETFLQPLQGWRIVVDPGTGGELLQTPFIEGVKQDLLTLEAEANRRIATFLSDSLKKAGAEVRLSRERKDTILPSIDERLKKAEEFNANLIISINHEYAKNSKENFVKCYYYPQNTEPDKSIATHITQSLENELELPSRGAEVFAYPLLARSKAPSVMISFGCASNAKYRKSIRDVGFNLKQARGALKGMMNFQKESSAFTTPQPPLTVMETRSPLLAPPSTAFTLPAPPLPSSPQPAPQPIQDITAPVTREISDEDVMAPFKPPFLNPLGANFDQSWLYGETWGSLPVRKGVAFASPAGAEVKAAESGVVIEVTGAFETPEVPYVNCVIIEHRNLMPNVPTAYSIYGRLAKILVKKGDRVKRGEVIGIAGEPSSTTNPSRETEIEFQIRLNDLSEDSVANPELFTERVLKNTGVIVGRLVDKNGQNLAGVRIDGVSKPSEIERYLYSLTYAQEMPPSKQYNENFAIGDVPEGEYYLSCEFGLKKVRAERGKITRVTWRVE